MRTIGYGGNTTPPIPLLANCTNEDPAAMPYNTWQTVLITIVALLLIVGTIGGNVLVVTAIGLVKRLHQQPANLLILSLAASDFLVGSVVMPLSLAYSLMGRWTLGDVLCDIWTFSDVIVCTSSILTLCAISVDRYLAITRPFTYSRYRKPSIMFAMIGGVWLVSAFVSAAPYVPAFGWRDERDPDVCMVSQKLTYQIYATVGAFYLPLGIMLALYGRIFLISRRIAESEARSRPKTTRSSSNPHSLMVGGTGSGGGGSGGPSSSRKQSGSGISADQIDMQQSHSSYEMVAVTGDEDDAMIRKNGSAMRIGRFSRMKKSLSSTRIPFFKRQRTAPNNGSDGSNKDQKAIRTLGVIMGCFMACWIPFFICALVKPFCAYSIQVSATCDDLLEVATSLNSTILGNWTASADTVSALPKMTVPGGDCIPDALFVTLTWLGYVNSFLNPIIYARFNRDFRQPFRLILMCKCRGINTHLRKNLYAEQFGTRGRTPNAAANAVPDTPL